MDDSILSKINLWLEQLASEIVLAEAETDKGLLPIRQLFADLRDKTERVSEFKQFYLGAKFGTEVAEAAIESQGFFSANDLAKFNDTYNQLLKIKEQPETLFVPLVRETGMLSSAQSQTSVEPQRIVQEEELPLEVRVEQDGDLIKEFLTESNEHLSNIEQGILVLEENPQDAETLNAIFRAFHTFKGGSGFLHLLPINRLAHELESLLDLARQGKLTITADVINIILEGQDVLRRFIEEIEAQVSRKKPVERVIIPTCALKERIRVLQQGKPMVATPVLAKAEKTPTPMGTSTGSINKNTSTTVKVDIQKLDTLIDLVGEMVIAESLVSQDPALPRVESAQLLRNMAHLGRITHELQRTAMTLRMVPIRSTFQKMNRLVRDLAAQVGKQVELKMSGEETELDRTLVEDLADPLLHMIRNAVDHGIEKPEVRVASGKSAQGTVHLQAFHQGGRMVIQISDDGAGLNPERIRKKALERGLIAEKDSLSEQQIFHLIFAAGFSTAEQVTDLSGRGVGMDVVQRNIEKLRGKIEIASVLGKGCVFTISLPLTLAIIDGLVVNVGHQRYVVPTLAVRESFRPTSEMVSTLHEKGEMVNVRGQLNPLLRLYQYLGTEPKTTDPTQAIILVLESGQERRCVLVDELVGTQEVVIKNLGSVFQGNKALAGAAILGDGQVGLILNVHDLVKLSSGGVERN